LSSSSSDFEFSFLTTDSSTSSYTPFSTATSIADLEGGEEPEVDVDPLDYMPSEFSDVPYSRHGDQMDDEDGYGGWDFSLRALGDE
jgi:hypothetical protein